MWPGYLKTHTSSSSSSSSCAGFSSPSSSDFEKRLWQWAQIEEQPEVYRRSMKWIEAGDCQAALNLSGLGLKSLPELWPEGLRKLDISNNQIIRLPERWPAALEELDFHNNFVKELPQELPYPTMKSLNLAGNHFSVLPMLLSTLHADCVVRLSDNPLSAENISQFFRAQGKDICILRSDLVQEQRAGNARLGKPFARVFKRGEGEELLAIAIQCNRPDKVAQLLGHPEIDLNSAKCGMTPLMCASLLGFREIVRLVSREARVNPNLKRPGRASTALHLAVGAAPMVMACVEALLCRSDIDPTLPNENGQSVLQIACSRGDQELVARLLKLVNIDPNSKGCKTQGRPLSPLSIALMRHPHIAPMLLAHPAIDVEADSQINVNNGQRASALGVAMRLGHFHLVASIMEKGGVVDPKWERAVQRRIAREAGKSFFERLVAPDEFLNSAVARAGMQGKPGEAQREQARRVEALSETERSSYLKLKSAANALLKNLYQLPLERIPFHLGAIAWHCWHSESTRMAANSSLYSDALADARLKDFRILENVLGLRGLALPPEQWQAIRAAVVQWLRQLSSVGEDGETAAQEPMLETPRQNMSSLLRDMLAGWGL